jgi:hypothetical protein
MKLTRLWVPALLVFAGISVATAQNSIRLRFELYQNGTQVGNPEVSVKSGTAGSLGMTGNGTIAFTATFRDSDSASIAFDIDSGGRHLTPRLVLRRNDPGSVSWSSTDGNEAFKFIVTWVR